MNQWRTCACVLGALLLTGCTAAGAAEHVASHGTGHSPVQATGHVTGKLLIEGGPISLGGHQPGERPIPGYLGFFFFFDSHDLHRAGHPVQSVRASKFSPAPPPYHVARSPT